MSQFYTRRSARAITTVPNQNFPTQCAPRPSASFIPLQEPLQPLQAVNEPQGRYFKEQQDHPMLEQPHVQYYPAHQYEQTSFADFRFQKPEAGSSNICQKEVPGNVYVNYGVSATTKALKATQRDVFKKPWGVKLKGSRIRKPKRERKDLSVGRLVKPKAPIQALNEFMPTVQYKAINEGHRKALAEVYVDGRLVASGRAASKHLAKNIAAAEAFKILTTEMMKKEAKDIEADDSSKVVNPGTTTEVDKDKDNKTDEVPKSALPWGDLANFALYKMFNEWGVSTVFLSAKYTASRVANRPTPKFRDRPLPPNASEMHPCTLLNLMRPGTIPRVLRHNDAGQNDSVTVAFDIDGQIFTGSGRNQRAARKAAAALAVTSIYGVTFPDTTSSEESQVTASTTSQEAPSTSQVMKTDIKVDPREIPEPPHQVIVLEHSQEQLLHQQAQVQDCQNIQEMQITIENSQFQE